METEVIIALGSNMHDPQKNLLNALSRLVQPLSAKMQCSSLWRSDPQDMAEDAGFFLNAVVKGQTRLSPRGLLTALQTIESSMGRKTDHAYHDSRIIDLDIITYGNVFIDELDLVIPHPRAHERKFVLLPLCELTPGFILPGQKLTVEELENSARAMNINRLSPPPVLPAPSPTL